MSDLDALFANLSAENLALRSLLTSLLIEMIRRGQIGVVSNAFAYARAPLEGLTQKIRPSPETRENARQILLELRNEVLGVSEAERPAENGG